VTVNILTKFVRVIFRPSRHCVGEHSELCDRSNNAEDRKIDKQILKYLWSPTYSFTCWVSHATTPWMAEVPVLQA